MLPLCVFLSCAVLAPRRFPPHNCDHLLYVFRPELMRSCAITHGAPDYWNRLDWACVMSHHTTHARHVTSWRELITCVREHVDKQSYETRYQMFKRRVQAEEAHTQDATWVHRITPLSADVFSAFAHTASRLAHETAAHDAYAHVCQHGIPTLAQMCDNDKLRMTAATEQPTVLIPRHDDGRVDVSQLMHRAGVNMRLIPILHAHLDPSSPLRLVLLHEMMCRTLKCRYRRLIAHVHTSTTAQHNAEQQAHATLSISAADALAATLLVHLLRQLFSPHHSDAEADALIHTLWREAQVKYAHDPEAMLRTTTPHVDAPICQITRTIWCDALQQLRIEMAYHKLSIASHQLIRLMCATFGLEHDCVTTHAHIVMDAEMDAFCYRAEIDSTASVPDDTRAFIQLMHVQSTAPATATSPSAARVADAATASLSSCCAAIAQISLKLHPRHNSSASLVL